MTHAQNPSESPRKAAIAAIIVISTLALALALILNNHGVTWWYAPLAVVAGSIAGHLVIALAAVWIAGRVLRQVPDSARPDQHSGSLIRRPRLYDWLVRTMSFGREGEMRAGWLAFAGVSTGDALLDVGCGTGTVLIAAAERVGLTGSLQGVEPAQEMLDHGRAKADALGIPVGLELGSACALPFEDDAFDKVLCTLVLHHLPLEKQLDALGEMRRVLRPGGRVLVVDMSHRPKGLRRFLSLIALLHGDQSGKLVDVATELQALGFGRIQQQAGGGTSLIATRAELPLG